MIDYIEVEGKYPQAYQLLIKWISEEFGQNLHRDESDGKMYFPSDGVIPTEDCIEFNDRYLFDFFDKNEIFIETTITPSKIDDHVPWFEYMIKNGKGKCIIESSTTISHYRRHSTETPAFMEAFKILEKRLPSIPF